jgi:hypothetical protein
VSPALQYGSVGLTLREENIGGEEPFVFIANGLNLQDEYIDLGLDFTLLVL